MRPSYPRELTDKVILKFKFMNGPYVTDVINCKQLEPVPNLSHLLSIYYKPTLEEITELPIPNECRRLGDIFNWHVIACVFKDDSIREYEFDGGPSNSIDHNTKEDFITNSICNCSVDELDVVASQYCKLLKKQYSFIKNVYLYEL